ncbi:haloalkane dehalogenase [bacterium BMS3Abin07]|nr:haloalkane dehalogenase [bacterium BMS3Abin07]GBE31675.1 haloalkane dehalogenase [bacterium BMS3Bbin05]
MSIIRTPDERFSNLPGFPFDPHYVEINGLRVHYVDEGQGETILCLHGEPTWSSLYRKMIPALSVHYRVIAMDFIGFGRSDKFTEKAEYSFQMHLDTLAGFIEVLALEHITLVVQDWGGLIGLTLASEKPQRFARLVIMNTGLPVGHEPMSDAFLSWRRLAERLPNMPIGRVIRMGLVHGNSIGPEIIAAYEAPFPDASYKAGASVWPMLVPLDPQDPGAAEMQQARAVLSEWQKPAIVMFSDSDPITREGDRFFRKLIPTAKNEPDIVIKNAGHFLITQKYETF